MRWQRASQVCAVFARCQGRWFPIRGSARAVTLAAILMTGCAGGGGGSNQSTALLPVVTPATSSPNEGYLTTAGDKVIPVYSRIAAGLNACWLRPDRPLGRKYILNATVAPPPTHSAELIVHVRSKEGRHGLKAFTVSLASIGSSATRVQSLNLKLPEPQGRQVAADIARWARGESACEAEADWAPNSGETASVETPEPELLKVPDRN